jgi:hypothetical protein
MPCAVDYCSGSDEGQIMDYYHTVSIIGGSIKDEEFLDQLSDCQLIKEDCFIEALLSAFETMSFKIAPVIFFMSFVRHTCEKQPENCA